MLRDIFFVLSSGKHMSLFLFFKRGVGGVVCTYSHPHSHQITSAEISQRETQSHPQSAQLRFQPKLGPKSGSWGLFNPNGSFCEISTEQKLQGTPENGEGRGQIHNLYPS